ncbi:MAG: hypothetical protein NZ922_06590 [Candidatus Methanomethyliaceae archaeon]|nr:hypothetical protein [Candidatus Methanomethyliaceae archaeon]MDW7970893.1 signal recognition particle subunit SRP19/SEC65 family protein [Nitrososphaerota archaeon]
METDYYIIWPQYLNSRFSRSRGRRVPRKMAVESPSIEEIFNACKELGLDAIIERDKCFPRTPWDKSGRVLVKGMNGKLKILLKVCEVLRKNRQIKA